MLTTHTEEDRQPIFSEDEKSMYYLNERSGVFNVHKRPLENPNQDQQLTTFKIQLVQFLSFGNGTLSFGFDGELYTMKERENPKKININIITQDKKYKRIYFYK